MKKLISELESLEADYKSNVSAADKDIADGIQLARKFVESHKPWYPVTELPPKDEKEPDFSIDVMVTNGEGYRLGYYAFRTESWVLHKYFRGDSPTHWAYLPEVKP